MNKIHRQTFGKGKPIVLVHGWAMHGGIWRGFAEQLAENSSRGLVNRVTDVKLLQGDLSEAWRENNDDYATVAMGTDGPATETKPALTTKFL